MIDFIDLKVSDVTQAEIEGAKKLGVTPEEVEVEVLDEEKKGWFGKPSLRVRVYRKEQEALPEEKEADPSKEKVEEKQEKEKENKFLGEVNGDFAIYAFFEDGLYVTVPSPVADEPPVEYLQAVEEVTKMGFVNLDLDALAKAVEAPGTKVKIGPPQPKHLLSASLLKVAEPKGSYIIYDFRDDGVYAKAQLKGTPLDPAQVKAEIEERGLKNVDSEQLLKLIEGSTEEVKLAPVQPQEVLKKGRCEITIAEDEMKATLKITPPFGGSPVTESDIQHCLKEHHITVEVDKEKLVEILEIGKSYSCETTIHGYPPSPGSDATLEFLFSKEKVKHGPRELEDGRVDYKELGVVQNVSKGDILIIKHPPGLGSPGMTVTGKEIPPLPGKDIPLLGGKGTEVDENGLQLIAAIDGQPVLQGKKVVVLPVFEVKGDVDLSVGNVDFVGNVLVRGNVLSGLTVKAAGEVDISGNVEDALVQAKGNIRIKGGVYGHGKAVIQSAQSIAVRFGENATFEPAGNLKVGEALMHCQVSCGKKVEVGGRKGVIVGGTVLAGESVNARVIGNRFATPTVIEVGIDPKLREELQEVRKRTEKEQSNLQKTQKALETLKALQKASGALPPDKQELVLKLTRTQFQLMAQLKQLVTRKHELEELTKRKSSGKVAVSDTVYSGVSITIGDVNMQTKDELRYVSLTEKDGEIRQRSYTK